MIDLVRRKISNYSPTFLEGNKEIRASVLIPIFENGGNINILLTKRAETVKYHKGEISFPGGMFEEEDNDAGATAIRECWEEVGIKPEDMDIIGRLDDMRTFTGFVISPFVAFIPYPYNFTLNPDEVTYLIKLPLPHLLVTSAIMEQVEFRGFQEEAPAIYYQNERIWGATCRILLQLKGIIQQQS
jgi:8-oxo-dGTP pyrophosphatase MutT (NUDIX family)